MIFATPDLSPKAFEVHDRVEELRKKLRHETAARQWRGFLSRVMMGRAIQGSNSIEGYNITADDSLAAAEGEQPLDANAQVWAEIMGYRQAMTYILQLADDSAFAYSAQLVSALHYMMLQHDLRKRPGRWRQGAVYVRNSETGETVYTAPDFDIVPDLLAELVTLLNQRNATPIMVKAAMAHLNFTMIHPFVDGNGRMARALQTLVLAREGILAPEFCSIEEYLGRYRSDYYAVLGNVGAGAWHPERDASAWVRFCLTAHYRQATTLLRRNKEAARLWSELEMLTEKMALPDRVLSALADAALGYKVRNVTYRAATSVSAPVASVDLNTLVKRGLLIPEGQQRGRYYTASPLLRQIGVNIREPKPQIEDPFDEEPTSVAVPALKQPPLPGVLWWDADV